MSSTYSSQTVIKNPTTATMPYYCTEDEWRSESGYTDQTSFPSDEVAVFLRKATEKVKKDAFYMIRYELVTKDSNDRYFVSRNFFANKYGAAADGETEIIHGEVTKYDIEVFQGTNTGTGLSSFSLLTNVGRVNRIFTPVPYDAITEIDARNGYFKLSSDYPTTGNQIFITYWTCGKPLEEIHYELKQAAIFMTTIFALKNLKRNLLQYGITSYQMGRRSINFNDESFDKMIKELLDEYNSWINWFKPFIGRKASIGRAETYPDNWYGNRRGGTYTGGYY